jgi:hypothetical protein
MGPSKVFVFMMSFVIPSVALQIYKDSQHDVVGIPLEGFFGSDTNDDLFAAVAACLPAPFEVFAGSASELEGDHDNDDPALDQGYVQVNFQIVGPPGTPLPDIDSECVFARMKSSLEQESGYDAVNGAYVVPVKLGKTATPEAGTERNDVENVLKTVLTGGQSNAQSQTLAKLGKAFTPVGRTAFTPVGQEVDYKGTNFMGKGFTYLPEEKRKDLYGYNPKKDSDLGADDNVLGNVPFLMAYGNKTTNKENAPYHGTFPAHFTSYSLAKKTSGKEIALYNRKFPAQFTYPKREVAR